VLKVTEQVPVGGVDVPQNGSLAALPVTVCPKRLFHLTVSPVFMVMMDGENYVPMVVNEKLAAEAVAAPSANSNPHQQRDIRFLIGTSRRWLDSSQKYSADRSSQ
jgi:hypothetical protein